MADEFRIADESGLTYTGEVQQLDGTAVGSPVGLTYSNGLYRGDIPGATPAGTYNLVYTESGETQGAETIVWDGSNRLEPDAFATADVSGLATAAAVGAIPTNPLLTNDARLDNLDAAISDVPNAAEIVDALAAASVDVTLESSLTEAGDLVITKNERLVFSVSGLTIPEDYGRCVLTIAKSLRDSDDESILQADSASGLLRLNGEAPDDADNASLTVDQAGGVISGEVLVAAVAAIQSHTVLYYAVRHMSPTEGPARLFEGNVIIKYSPGKATS